MQQIFSHIKSMSSYRWSIRRRMIWSISLFSIILFMLLGMSAYQVALQESQEILDRQMQEMAYFLAKTPIDHLDSSFRPNHRYDETDVFIDIWKYHPTPEQLALHEDPEKIRAPRARKAEFLQVRTSRGLLKIFVLPLEDRQIQISQLIRVRRHLAKELAFSMLAPYVILVPLVLFGLAMLTQHALKPLVDLQRFIALRGHHDLTPITMTHLPSEIKPVIDELNWLFKRIDEAQKKQQQFIADAAHELRSPLTALNLQLTVLQRTNAGHDEQLAGMENLKKGLTRIQHLVTQMMTLAHQEAQQHVSIEPVDLLEQTRFVLGQLMLSARKKHIDIGLVEPENLSQVMVKASISPLQSVISNILDNAIKYTPPRGTIDVCLRTDEHYAYLVVEDSGQGVAEDQYQNILGRFVRLPETQHKVIGSGLGLSIVHAALQQLGGQIHFAKSAKLGGLSVTVQLQLS